MDIPSNRPSCDDILRRLARKVVGQGVRKDKSIVEASAVTALISCDVFSYESTQLLTALFKYSGVPYFSPEKCDLVRTRVRTEIKAFVHSLSRVFNAIEVDLPCLLPLVHHAITCTHPCTHGCTQPCTQTMTHPLLQSSDHNPNPMHPHTTVHPHTLHAHSTAEFLDPSGLPVVVPTSLLLGLFNTLSSVKSASLVRRFAIQTVCSCTHFTFCMRTLYFCMHTLYVCMHTLYVCMPTGGVWEGNVALGV